MVDTIRTKAELLTIFADGQAEGAITPQDMRDLVVSMNSVTGAGWEFHLDGTYTSGSPRTILAGVRTKVTIDGTAADFGHPSLLHADGHFWDTATNKVTAANLNSFAIGRFAVTAESVSDNANYFDVELDVTSGSFPIIFRETGVLSKGSGIDEHFNFIAPLFVGADFLANGAEIYVIPKADMRFHTFAITINRTYLP